MYITEQYVAQAGFCNGLDLVTFTFSHLGDAPERLTVSTGTFPRVKSGEVPCPRTQRHLAQPEIETVTITSPNPEPLSHLTPELIKFVLLS